MKFWYQFALCLFIFYLVNPSSRITWTFQWEDRWARYQVQTRHKSCCLRGAIRMPEEKSHPTSCSRRPQKKQAILDLRILVMALSCAPMNINNNIIIFIIFIIIITDINFVHGFVWSKTKTTFSWKEKLWKFPPRCSWKRKSTSRWFSTWTLQLNNGNHKKNEMLVSNILLVQWKNVEWCLSMFVDFVSRRIFPWWYIYIYISIPDFPISYS